MSPVKSDHAIVAAQVCVAPPSSNTPAPSKEVATSEGSAVCPGCGMIAPDLRKHMKRCCPELLPERQQAPTAERIAKRREASEDDWISEDEVRACAAKSFEAIEDPLLRRVLELRFGTDRNGERRTPMEVADALGGKHKGNAQAALNLVRTALKSVPLVADDPSNLQVLYEDEELLAVSKPPFLRSTPVHRFTGKSLTNQIVGYMQQSASATRQSHGEAQTGQRTAASPLLLHRLDQTTSGVVLCAKTKKAASFLQDLWHKPECRKEYLAVAWRATPGSLTKVGDALRVDEPIGKDVNSSDPVRRAVNYEEGQSAVTRFEVLAEARDVLLLSCTLVESGRTHQIRIHSSHSGLPLLGDGMYGGDERYRVMSDRMSGEGQEAPAALGRVALHAWRLHITHPGTKMPLLIEAGLPADLQQCLRDYGLQWSADTSQKGSARGGGPQATSETSAEAPASQPQKGSVSGGGPQVTSETIAEVAASQDTCPSVVERDALAWSVALAAATEASEGSSPSVVERDALAWSVALAAATEASLKDVSSIEDAEILGAAHHMVAHKNSESVDKIDSMLHVESDSDSRSFHSSSAMADADIQEVSVPEDGLSGCGGGSGAFFDFDDLEEAEGVQG